MKFLIIAVAAILCGLLLSACGRNEPAVKPISGPPQAGLLYSFNDGEGGYRVGKVVAVEDEVVFVSLFRERWTKRPALAEARQATTPIPIAYSLITMAGMQPVRLEEAKVTPEEFEAFEEWKRGKRELF